MFRGETAIEFESTLERDFLVRKEFSLAVLDVVPQPCQIRYHDAGTNRHRFYTPDFLVYYRLGNRHYEDYPKPVLVEVKPEAEWRNHWRKWLPKWKAAYRYAKEQGWIFHIHDETRIRDQTYDNIRFLSRYKRMIYEPIESQTVLTTVNQMGFATVDYLLARHFMGIYRTEGLAHIWHLLSARRLDCDMSRPLNNFTEVWVPTDE
ncbi:TnsA endonuclease N-terminal domain-containing protein [Desulfonatronum parangueonense]